MTDTFFDIETSGLDPFNDQILTIQVKRGECVQLWKLWEEDNESDMIEKYFRFLDNIDSKEAIYGYNILLFDLPFIWTRLSLLSEFDIEKYRLFYYRNWKDLYQYLGKSYCSLDRWLSYFDIERQCNYSGKDMPKLFREKKYDKIELHAIDDLIVCEKLVKKLHVDTQMET